MDSTFSKSFSSYKQKQKPNKETVASYQHNLPVLSKSRERLWCPLFLRTRLSSSPLSISDLSGESWHRVEL